jgi:protein-tyrosine phosphatase
MYKRNKLVPSFNFNLGLSITICSKDIQQSPKTMSSNAQPKLNTPHSTPTASRGLFPSPLISKNEMDQIIPNLWLGEVLSDQQIIENNFTHVLSVIEESPKIKEKNVRVMHVKIKDSGSENITDYFDKCSDFIHDALDENGKIYVHCRQGLSRSPSIIIAYIMRYGICNDSHCVSFNEALQFVSKKRPEICPNLGFNLALQDYEKKLSEKK